MITKERIDELIQQRAKVWGVGKQGNVFCVGLKFRPETLKSPKWLENKYEYYGKFFESKAEAEWHAEFGYIERTERLELPTWEEFNKSEKMVRFIGKNGEKCKLEGYFNLNLQSGFIDVVENGSSQLSLSEYTKENYTLACRKCKELFLGENK